MAIRFLPLDPTEATVRPSDPHNHSDRSRNYFMAKPGPLRRTPNKCDVFFSLCFFAS